MKISLLLRYRAVLLKRRNKAQRLYSREQPGPHNLTRVRLDTEVETLDRVLDGLDRLILCNHDRFHDRRKKS